MTEISNRNQILERLARVVEAYGADEARWPEKDRTQLAALIATDEQAQELVREAQALDRLLGRGDDVATSVAGASAQAGATTSDMADRIMAAIERERAQDAGQGQQGAEIIALPVGRPVPSTAMPAPMLSPGGWVSAAALAASLLLGVFVGASGYLETATSSVGEIAGLAISGETLQIGDGFGPMDEDYL